MEKENSHYLINNLGLSLFLLKMPKDPHLNKNKKKQKMNNYNLEIIKKINYDIILKKEFKNHKKTNNMINNKENPERYLKQIDFIPKMNKENLLHNIFLNNKIIFVEGIKAWENYGVTKNKYCYALFNELSKITISENFFYFEEKTNKILFNMLKTKIKIINEDKNNIGSAVFCGLFFNREFDKMISISVGNILYSILRESSRQKYEIIYISTEQYHDINIPYQLSAFNEDYNYLNINYHNININDIILVGNNKKIILSIVDKINTKEDSSCNIEEIKIRECNNCNNYLGKYKIIDSPVYAKNTDNLSISSTSSSF